jgi:hypothetical protein
MHKMNDFFKEPHSDEISSFNSYILLTDISKQKLYLDEFN